MFWHEMTKEQPTDNDVRYLLMGNGGGLYVGYLRANGKLFYIPNNRSSYLEIKSVKAWAVIPEFGDQQ